MADPTYQRRFMAQADANPAALDAYARKVLGHDMATAERLLGIHRSLIDGKKLDANQHQTIRNAFPTLPIRQLAGIVQKLNEQPPHTRADIYLGLLAGDIQAVQGNYAEVGETFKQLQAFTKAYHTEAAAEQINAKRETTVDPEVKARTIERKPEDPMSTRALIAAQIDGQYGRDARTVSEAAERGDPRAEAFTRESLARSIEEASAKLDPDAEDVSRRDSVAAAFEMHQAEEVGKDLGYIAEEQT